MEEDKEYNESFQSWIELTKHQVKALSTDIENIEKEVVLKKKMLANVERQLQSALGTDKKE